MEFGKRLSYAFRCFISVLTSGEIPSEIAAEINKGQAPHIQSPIPEAPPAPRVEPRVAEPVDRAVQMLALLQRDGRLVDFIAEDITPYQDAQIGAAVRDVHESCRKVIKRYLELEPVISSDEGQAVTVEPGFDPAAIKLIGNVTGKPPLRGLLRHRGWRVTRVNMPPLPDGGGREIIAPAEVEIM
ncbi:MAG: DUF2760 domain-containing protein [Acidobacteria bacterium]|nr:DUF2760 domain-containing protein [Acidobacteriota bacterium]